MIAGFENHGGRTYLGAGEQPLGRVLSGHGNNGKDGFEGVHRGNVIGTYLHGPLLPKNVWLADRLIELALGVELEPLDDAWRTPRTRARVARPASDALGVPHMGVDVASMFDPFGPGNFFFNKRRVAVAFLSFCLRHERGVALVAGWWAVPRNVRSERPPGTP